MFDFITNFCGSCSPDVFWNIHFCKGFELMNGIKLTKAEQADYDLFIKACIMRRFTYATNNGKCYICGAAVNESFNCKKACEQ